MACQNSHTERGSPGCAYCLVINSMPSLQKSPLVRLLHPGDQRLLAATFLQGAIINGCAVACLSAEIDATVADQLLNRTQISVWMYSTKWPCEL